MAQFEYRAMNAAGAVLEGKLEAVHQQDLMAQLGRLGLTLVRAKEHKARKARLGSLSRRDIILMFFHLQMLVRAGVPLPTAMADLRDTATEPALQQLAAGLCERINNGQTIANAMSAYPQVFSAAMLNLIRAGEATGELAEVMSELLTSLKWEDELAAKTKKLLSYPAFVGTVIVAAAAFLMIYLVPQMTGFIKSMGHELPFHTKALIATSNFIQRYWWALLLTPPIIVAVMMMAAKRSPQFRYRLHEWGMKVPLLGSVYQKTIMARVAETLGLMYRSGIPLLEAIGHCANVSTNPVTQEAMVQVRQKVSEGVGLADAFAAQSVFPPLVIRMLRVGESTGALDEALRNVRYFYARDIDESIARIEAAIEPLMTVTLGLLIGWIMLSVMGPLYDTISKLKT